MSRSRNFSIYLLKKGYGPSNALQEDHPLDASIPANGLPEDASLFVLDRLPQEPWWKEYFGVEADLSQTHKGALVFLPVDGRCFALSFGHVFQNLLPTSYEHDFGLRVTLNSVDHLSLKSTDILEPGAARRKRTQLPVGSDLTYFDFERDSSILRRLTGKVKDEYQGLFKNATGAHSLQIGTPVQASELVNLCRQLLELYRSSDFEKTFPDVRNISPIRDPESVERLDGLLMDAFRAKADNLYLAIPDIVDYGHNVRVSFSGVGRSLIYDDVFIDLYYEYLAQNNRSLETAKLEDLRKHRLRLTDDDGFPRKTYPIYASLVFDAQLDDEKTTYHLTEGQWYAVRTEYIDELEEFLDGHYSELSLPDYVHPDEATYNKHVAETIQDFVCLDRTNISPQGQTQIEPCDLCTPANGCATLYHVKVSTQSARLSHLFNQGVNAVQLLKLEESAVSKLQGLLRDRAAEGVAKELHDMIDRGEFRVVFAIVTHKPKGKRSANLPLFSRISLARALRSLCLMGVKGSYGFVLNKSPRAQGKKKPRKTVRRETARKAAAA